MVYLDYNATAPLLPAIKDAMISVMGEAANPSSIHASGRKARKLIEESRRRILLSVNAENLIFCGSGTEANNLALHQAEALAISAIEHESVYKTTPKATIIRVKENGIVDLEHLQEILTSGKYKLVSLMLANNETGIIQPVKLAARIAHEHGAMIHCDAVQAYGKIGVDFKDLDIDMMTISGHKVGGPVGSAALILKSGLEIKPLLFGGGQEKNKRPGTENVPAIVGLGALAKMLSERSRQPGASAGAQQLKNVSRETIDSGLRDYLEAEIPEAIIYGKDVDRLPNTSCLAMPEMGSATQLIHFDSNGLCVSAGSACSSGKVEVSRTLKAMNVASAANAIRVSTGWATTREEVDIFIKSWRELYLRSMKAA